LDRSYSLRRNKDFQYVYRRGRRYASKVLALVYLRGNTIKVGFSIGKKIGNSVQRNKLKRRMREAFRSILPDIKPGKYIFIAREGSSECDYWTILKTIKQLVDKSGAWSEKKRCDEKASFKVD
jgi:ribonuclease P protein component